MIVLLDQRRTTSNFFSGFGDWKCGSSYRLGLQNKVYSFQRNLIHHSVEITNVFLQNCLLIESYQSKHWRILKLTAIRFHNKIVWERAAKFEKLKSLFACNIISSLLFEAIQLNTINSYCIRNFENNRKILAFTNLRITTCSGVCWYTVDQISEYFISKNNICFHTFLKRFCC